MTILLLLFLISSAGTSSPYYSTTKKSSATCSSCSEAGSRELDESESSDDEIQYYTRPTHLPSPLFAPSPSTATRSKRPRLVTVKRIVIPPKRLEPNWSRFKFTGCAEVDDIAFEPREEKSPIEYFRLFFSDDIISLIM
ncbi:unnamed protein product [Parnassius apollo]|uniref:(apollo) hypothetical protein n=1 Tax=Parnassius apollo TaxID=110799 RepID=A0A8S3YGG5_PARAO|nr:unnamed protein product [Parnassius apollo]